MYRDSLDRRRDSPGYRDSSDRRRDNSPSYRDRSDRRRDISPPYRGSPRYRSKASYNDKPKERIEIGKILRIMMGKT